MIVQSIISCMNTSSQLNASKFGSNLLNPDRRKFTLVQGEEESRQLQVLFFAMCHFKSFIWIYKLAQNDNSLFFRKMSNLDYYHNNKNLCKF